MSTVQCDAMLMFVYRVFVLRLLCALLCALAESDTEDHGAPGSRRYRRYLNTIVSDYESETDLEEEADPHVSERRHVHMDDMRRYRGTCVQAA